MTVKFAICFSSQLQNVFMLLFSILNGHYPVWLIAAAACSIIMHEPDCEIIVSKIVEYSFPCRATKNVSGSMKR